LEFSAVQIDSRKPALTSFSADPQQRRFGRLQVDDRLDDSEYHFSWRHDGSKTYTWDGANQYCRSLGSGWQGISIETREEDSLVSKAISGGNSSN